MPHPRVRLSVAAMAAAAGVAGCPQVLSDFHKANDDEEAIGGPAPLNSAAPMGGAGNAQEESADRSAQPRLLPVQQVSAVELPAPADTSGSAETTGTWVRPPTGSSASGGSRLVDDLLAIAGDDTKRLGDAQTSADARGGVAGVPSIEAGDYGASGNADLGGTETDGGSEGTTPAASSGRAGANDTGVGGAMTASSRSDGAAAGMEATDLGLTDAGSSGARPTRAAAGAGRDPMVEGSAGEGGSDRVSTAEGSADRESTDLPSTVEEATEEVIDCSDKLPLNSGVVADFDAWDGSTDLYRWSFGFSVDSESGAASGGFYEYHDGSGDYSLSLVAGVDGSGYAASATNPAASRWGGGVSLWVHCLDASSFAGVQFWIRGRTPAGTAELAIRMDNVDLVYEFSIPREWRQFKVPLADFRGATAQARGDGVTAIIFSSQLRWGRDPSDPTRTVAQEGAFEVTVDEIGFYR
ncbi:hypothetical protein ACFL5O_03175 [Myxococcota bacterium]